ncbi:outer membrane beta-barrel protein [Lacinutrix undariae]
MILKEDKKNIVFGNAEAATDFNEFYKLHAALFQFKKKQQNNAILDVNNIAENGISISDSHTFLNVNSTLFDVVDVPVNYMINDTDFSEVKNQLATVNLKRTKTNSTWDFLSYYNKISTTEEEEERRENLENFSVEKRFMIKEKTSDALFFRLKNDMFTSKKERLFSFHFYVKKPEKIESIISESDFGNKNISTSNDETIINSSVIFEETKQINKASSLVYGVNLDYKKDKEYLNLNSDLIFLEDQINWLNQDTYKVGRKENIEKAKAIAAAQYYYTINKHHVFLLSLGLGYDYENAVNNQAQMLDDNSQNSLGNVFNSDTQLNTVKIVPQFSYSYFKNQWEANFGAKLSMVDWRFKNAITKNNNFITAFNPFLYVQYSVNDKKKFSISYNKRINLPSRSQLDNYTQISSYNSVFKGNPNLGKAIAHALSLSYSDYNIPKKYSWYSNNTLEINEKGFSSDYIFDGINLFSTPILIDNQRIGFSTRNSFFYLFKNFEVGIDVNLSKTKQNLIITDLQEIISDKISVFPKIKTTFKSLPELSFTPYLKAYQQKNKDVKTRTKNIGYKFKIQHSFFKQYYANMSYTHSKFENQKAFNTLNFELRFTNKIKSLDFSVVGINALSSKVNSSVYQSPLVLIENSKYTLGRRILLKLNYNF